MRILISISVIIILGQHVFFGVTSYYDNDFTLIIPIC